MFVLRKKGKCGFENLDRKMENLRWGRMDECEVWLVQDEAKSMYALMESG